MTMTPSLLELPLVPPFPAMFNQVSAPSLPLIPAIVHLNKACVQDRKRRRKAQSRKTIGCRAWEECGRCNYGDKCKFAHGERELNMARKKFSTVTPSSSSNPHFRTLPCLKYALLGACPYEDRCTYLHGPKVDIESAMDEYLREEPELFLQSPSTDPFRSPSSASSASFDPFRSPSSASSASFDPFRSPISDPFHSSPAASLEFSPVPIHPFSF